MISQICDVPRDDADAIVELVRNELLSEGQKASIQVDPGFGFMVNISGEEIAIKLAKQYLKD